MKKLVLGIVSVFLTQLVFVAYNWTGDELAADVGRVSEFKIEAEPWPVIRSPRPPYPETTPEIAAAIEVEPKPATIIRAKAEPESKPRTVVAAKTRINTEPLFQPTVITYRTSSEYKFSTPPSAEKVKPTDEPQRPTVASAKPEKRKRSLLQKTGSVIKKPFVWIKDLVAKID